MKGRIVSHGGINPSSQLVPNEVRCLSGPVVDMIDEGIDRPLKS